MKSYKNKFYIVHGYGLAVPIRSSVRDTQLHFTSFTRRHHQYSAVVLLANSTDKSIHVKRACWWRVATLIGWYDIKPTEFWMLGYTLGSKRARKPFSDQRGSPASWKASAATISLSNFVSFYSPFDVCSLVSSAEADERWYTLRGPRGFLIEFSCKGSNMAGMRGSDGNTRMQSKHKPSSCWIPWIMNVLVTLGTVRKELPRYFSSRYLALLFNLLHSPRLQSPIPTRKR